MEKKSIDWIWILKRWIDCSSSCNIGVGRSARRCASCRWRWGGWSPSWGGCSSRSSRSAGSSSSRNPGSRFNSITREWKILNSQMMREIAQRLKGAREHGDIIELTQPRPQHRQGLLQRLGRQAADRVHVGPRRRPRPAPQLRRRVRVRLPGGLLQHDQDRRQGRKARRRIICPLGLGAARRSGSDVCLTWEGLATNWICALRISQGKFKGKAELRVVARCDQVKDRKGFCYPKYILVKVGFSSEIFWFYRFCIFISVPKQPKLPKYHNIIRSYTAFNIIIACAQW